jgi:glycosylphosphatidylinositol phospholipase D
LIFQILSAISAPFYQAGAIFIINGKKSGSLKTPLKSTNIFDIADKIIYAYNNDDDPQLRFGWSMSVVDLNKDGIDDLAVSAPSFGANEYTYYGKVNVYFGRKNEGLRENKADLEIIPKQDVLESEWIIEAFGQYMSSGDVDGDGFDDLLIGCPYCGLYDDNLRSVNNHESPTLNYIITYSI